MTKENLEQLKANINHFQINTIVNIKAAKLFFINEKLYVYLENNSIKIYDYKTFKEIANLKIPFERKKLIFEILENGVLVIFAAEKLYFYLINIEKNELSFMHYLSGVYNFCYLKKRKELFLLTELGSYEEKMDDWGMAKSDLKGNIIFANKIKRKIHYEFISPEPINQFDFPTHIVYNTKNFCQFNGFNDDKYILNISGYTNSWYDYKIGFGDTEIRFDTSIFNADNCNKLLDEEDHYNDLEYNKKLLIIYSNMFLKKVCFITMKKKI